VLLKRNYGLMWGAALVSGIGGFVLLAALPYFVYSTSGSALASGGAFMSEMLPMILFPALGGIYADRWKRKPVLVGSDWFRGLLVLPLVAVHGPSTLWIVYVCGFLGAAVGNFAGPFGSASIPHLVDHDDLGPANAAFSVGGNIATLVGFPLGGILLQRLGLSAVVVLDAASFVVSGLLVGSVNVSLEATVGDNVQTESSLLRRTWQEWRDGLGMVRDERWLTLLFVVLALTFLGNGALLTVLPAFVKTVLNGSAQFYSVVLAAQGAGGIVAAAGIGFVMKRVSPVQILALGLPAMGALAILAGAIALPSVTLVCFFLAGPPALFAVASLNTILQGEVSPGYLGRVFGTFLTVNALSSLLGALLAGALTDRFGSRLIMCAGGSIFLVAGVTAILVLAPTLQTSKTHKTVT